jgi:hypothetical protein
MPQSAVPVGLAQSFRPRKQFYTKMLVSNTVVLEAISELNQFLLRLDREESKEQGRKP